MRYALETIIDAVAFVAGLGGMFAIIVIADAFINS
jgi:hypothetical protein